MNVGQLIRFLEQYDESAGVEVEMHLTEAGEAHASTFDVTVGSRDELESGERNDWPTISASVGFGTMAEKELMMVIDCVESIDRRLKYYKGLS
jgi:hypothetical protein